MLRQSIDNIELEKLESDMIMSQTPDRKVQKAAKSSLLADSSNQKQVSQFETPRAQVSQVQLKRHSSLMANSSCGDEIAAPEASNTAKQDEGGLRTLKLKKSSQ